MADYYFRLPPITDLTTAQQSALDETEPIALSGGPGTGKSVVSVWRHIRNHRQDKKSLLLTYTHSLVRYLRSCCMQQDSKHAANMVRTSMAGEPVKEKFAEIIIDEAQDLPPAYYGRLIKRGYTVSYGADDSQILYKDHCTKNSEFLELFPDNRECLLDRNFRSTQNIMLFAKNAFPNMFVPNDIIEGLSSNPGSKPSLSFGGSIYLKTLRLVREFATETDNVGVLIPWRPDVIAMYNFLIKNGIDCSYYVSEDCQSSCPAIKIVHVTTYRSSKGLEFDTVILPEFDYFYNLEKPQLREGRDVLSEQDMYVAVTRARSNLFLLNKQHSVEFDDALGNFVEQ